MFKVFDKYILSSDWHLFHTNILIYEFEKRKFLFKDIKEFKNIKSSKEMEDFITTLKSENNELLDTLINKVTENLLTFAYNDFLCKVDNFDIDEYFNLGDFLFNPNERRLSLVQDINYRKYLQGIKDVCTEKGIKSTFIIGNHDLPHGNIDITKFLSRYFDEIKDFEIREGEKLIFSHVPLGGSKSRYKLGDFHKRIDYALMDYMDNVNDKYINIHGHTHSSNVSPELIYKNVKYINVSIEQNIE